MKLEEEKDASLSSISCLEQEKQKLRLQMDETAKEHEVRSISSKNMLKPLCHFLFSLLKPPLE